MASTRLDLDLLAGDFYVNDPYSSYRWLRENEPLYWDSVNELWGVSRYDDIVEIEKNKKLFINSDKKKGGYRPNIPADASIIGLDDPQHTARRVLVSRRFTPRAVSSFEDHIRSVVRTLIDDFLQTGSGDIVEGLAAPLPAMMIGLLLGFPEQMAPSLRDWSARTIALGGGPRYHDDDGVAAVFEFTEACVELYEEKKKCPADDVMSTWVDTERTGMSDGTEFGLDQIISDCLLLLDGGAETTRTVIARTLVNLIAHPDQWQALRNGADLEVATEEFIRYVTPIHNMCRTAVADTRVNGTDIAAGQQLLLMYSSANRDPAHFHAPESFDVTREPNHHIAFGFGTHFCLGAALARLEIRIFFEEFVRRVADLRLLAGTRPVEMPNAFVYGLAEARVEVDPA
ncbi:MAG: cytochrome P450 [Acidimicrobiia bacterium]|nr:cytochrome P450 [Acidimicrobiia bacterium]MDH5237668.1 cytochrome P450 [Acidimicrobiia bacterium]